MNQEQRTEMLKLVRGGYDPEGAAVELGLPMSAVTKAGKKFRKQLDEAYRIATGRIRAKLLKSALADSDTTMLVKLLAARESREAEADPQPITLIKRIIIEPLCPHCGKPPIVRDGEGKVRLWIGQETRRQTQPH